MRWTLLFLLALSFCTGKAAAQKVYWTDPGSGTIVRANADGSDRETLVQAGAPFGIALDRIHGKIYWTNPVVGTIQRANLDGSQPEFVLDDSGYNNIAFDGQGRIYWTFGDSGIRRVDPDGTDIEVVLPPGFAPNSLAIATTAGMLYWSTAQGEIFRSDLDGAQMELLVTGLETIRGVALDECRGKMYWSDRRKIQRSNLDGTNIQEVVQLTSRAPWGLALDLENDRVLWADPLSGRVSSTDLNGDDLLDLFEDRRPGPATPTAIAIDSPRDVLRLNGRFGRIDEEARAPIELAMNAALAGPSPGRFVLWVWDGVPMNSVNFLGSCVINPTPLHAGMSPQPIRCVASPDLVGVACQGTSTRTGPTATPWILRSNRGLPPATFSIQGLVENVDAASSSGFSLTNVLIVNVE